MQLLLLTSTLLILNKNNYFIFVSGKDGMSTYNMNGISNYLTFIILFL